jgi:hypothetical protein
MLERCQRCARSTALRGRVEYRAYRPMETRPGVYEDTTLKFVVCHPCAVRVFMMSALHPLVDPDEEN